MRTVTSILIEKHERSVNLERILELYEALRRAGALDQKTLTTEESE